MAVWWTASEISKVAEAFLESQKGSTIVKRHLKSLLIAEATIAAKDEVAAAVKQLVEEKEATLARQLSRLYSEQYKRLSGRYDEIEEKLKEQKPEIEVKIDELEDRLDEANDALDKIAGRPEEDYRTALQEVVANLKAEQAKRVASAAKRMDKAAGEVMRRLDELIKDRLHNALLQTVQEYVRSVPFEADSLTNRQYARAMGVSLREAKRRRQIAVGLEKL